MGKKALARSLIEKAFENIKRTQIERYHLASTQEEKDRIELDPKKILHQAIENSKPLLQLTPIKRGGITYQVSIFLCNSVANKHTYYLEIEYAEKKNSEDKVSCRARGCQFLK